MTAGLKITIKLGSELTEQELTAVNQAKAREWNEPPMGEGQKAISLFFLLKDSLGKILAQGQLIPIEGVTFNRQQFDIYGIGGIIANQKGQGFGKKLMLTIKEYLKQKRKAGIGFSSLNNIGFYQKCGFTADFTFLPRFVHVDGGKKITNTTEDYVFFTQSSDNFMKQVLDHPGEEIYLPRDPDW